MAYEQNFWIVSRNELSFGNKMAKTTLTESAGPTTVQKNAP
jgi:hypothetical protein